MTRVAAELETERLWLRQFEESDLDAYARIVGDAEAMRYIGDGAPQSREDAWRSIGYLLGHWKIRGFGLYAVVEKQSRDLVGRIGLYRPEGWPGLEVGWLVERRRWGQGLATEGAAAVMREAFTALDAERLISVILPPNAASIRVAEKLGESFDRVQKLQGKDVCIYAIDRVDWERG